MRIFSVGCVCDGKFGEGINTDILEAVVLKFGGSAVVVDGEGTLGQ